MSKTKVGYTCDESQQDTTLTSVQERAVLLLTAGRSVSDVAESVGVDRSTLWRWKNVPAFAGALNRARLDAYEAAADSLRGLADDATRTLKDLLNGEDTEPGLRLRAAVEVLKLARVGSGELDKRTERDLMRLEREQAYFLNL